jgi:hypothetical protein
MDLKAGNVAVSFSVAGKNASSRGYDAGIDAFLLRPAQ